MLLIVGGLGTFGILAALPFILESELFRGRLMELSPIYARISLYASGILILVDHPVFGIGLGRDAFETVKVDYLVSVMGISYDEGQRTGPPHNEWLGIMTMTGIFGLGTFIAIHVLVFKKLRDVRHDTTISSFQRLMAIYVMAIFVSQIVISMFVDTGYLIYTTSATFGAIGIVAAKWRKDDSGPRRTQRRQRHTKPIS
jgi:O-antigen ligase